MRYRLSRRDTNLTGHWYSAIGVLPVKPRADLPPSARRRVAKPAAPNSRMRPGLPRELPSRATSARGTAGACGVQSEPSLQLSAESSPSARSTGSGRPVHIAPRTGRDITITRRRCNPTRMLRPRLRRSIACRQVPFLVPGHRFPDQPALQQSLDVPKQRLFIMRYQ